MIFQSKIKVDWENIKSRKRKVTIYNNARENNSRNTHEYIVGDLILIIPHNSEKVSKLQKQCEVPYEILKVYQNGTVKIRRGNYDEIINIRRMKPYHTRKQHVIIQLLVESWGRIIPCEL